MSGSKRLYLFSLVVIFTIFLNLLFIGSGNADSPDPFIVSGPDQMSINQTATLSVSGGCGGPYTWTVISGGGSLSPTTGFSVNYTSPSSNPNCNLNPLISVTDKAGQIVYKGIAINAYTRNEVAYRELPCGNSGACGWQHCYREFKCNGEMFPIRGYCTGEHGPPTCHWWGDTSAYTTVWPGYIYGYALDTGDVRTQAMKVAGCCPPSSVPPAPSPVTVPQCTTCDLKINNFDGSNTIIDPRNGGAITFDAKITSSKPFTWTLIIVGGNSNINPIHGSGDPGSIIWNGKNVNNEVVYPGSYTATLSAKQIDDPNCKDDDSKSFKVTAREKDCKLEITANSSINAASGNLSHAQTLFTVPNSTLMSDFTLYYSSTDSYSGVLEIGWTHTYNVFLSTDPTDDAYILSNGRGGMISLYKNGDYYTSDISIYPTLQVNADNTFTLTYKNGTLYSFNTNGKLSAIADKNGNSVNLAYSSGGNLVNITDPARKVIYLSYDAGNRIIAITDPNNNSHAFTYSGNALTAVSSHNSLGTQTWGYTYDDKAFMLTKTDPSGNLVQYAYDEEHRVSRTIDPQGGTINVQYDPENNTTTVTEKDGGAWIYRYDPVLGALKSKTDPSGGTTFYEYDINRNVTSKIEPDGSTTEYTYDDRGNMISVTDALGNTTIYTYNDDSLVTSITDSLGRQTKYTYDVNSNILSTTDPTGATTHYTYDSKGNIIAITNPNGGITLMAYDSNNNLISITDSGGQTTSQAYDNLGNMISQTDAAGNKTNFQYNSLNQLIAVSDSKGNTTTYTYDANGNRLSVTDANGNTTTYDYNYRNQLIQITDAKGFRTSFTHGTGGCSSCAGVGDRLIALTDARNNTTTYQYDQTGRLIRETDPLGNSTTYEYDARGNMTSKTKPDGRTITYIYNELNQLVERKYPNNTLDIFQYDASGNMTMATNQNVAYYYSYDAGNRMTGVTNYNLAQIFNIEYQYDVMGNRTATTMKEGTSTPKVINYEYNLNNQMTKITSDTTGSYTFTYDALGRRIKRTLPNDSYTTYSYDQLSRLTGITHKNAFNKKIDSFAYSYDNVGNRLTKTDDHKALHYNYDPIYRLTKATPKSNNKLIQLLQETANHHSETYSYDPVGNRQTGPKANDSYNYDSGNELLTSKGHLLLLKKNHQYEYDPNGNLVKKTESIGKWNIITSYAYDDENRLITVTIRKGAKVKEISFTYDPFGRRISKTIEREEFKGDDDDKDMHLEHENDGHHGKYEHQGKHGHNDYPKTTFYIYDGQNIIAEYDQNNKQTASYIHGPNIDEPLSAEIRNTRIYYHADGLGSITTLTNHMGHKMQTYAYDSFGNIKSTPYWIKHSYTYTGREFDPETGLYYYRARYYDPKAGRFITKDPIKLRGGINQYAYVGNNPVNRIDPTGKFAFHGNYCGPNYGDLDVMNWVPPQEDGGLDECCYYHDKCYADNDVKTDCDLSKSEPDRDECNRKLCRCLSRANPPCKYWITQWALLKTFNCNGVSNSILWLSL